MSNIEINDCVYKVHPIYSLYASDKDGNIINIVKKVPTKGKKQYYSYMMCMVRKHAQKGKKNYLVHRFIWECFNGLIPNGKVIDHINDNKEDNRIGNLQLMTQQENCKKSAKDRDYALLQKIMYENKKCVKAINQNTNEVSYYNSMYDVQNI